MTNPNIRCLDCGHTYTDWQDKCDLCGGPVSIFAGTIHVGPTS